MTKILSIIIILNFVLQSCNFKRQTVLSKNSEFDLEVIDFQENIPKLYSKHILNSSSYEYDSISDDKLAEETLRYEISNLFSESMKLKIPQKDFGYLYKSPELDSIAKFQNVYFNFLFTLTDTNKNPVAYYSETVFYTAKQRVNSLDEINEKYGKPKYSIFIDDGFNVCAYEWDLTDRTIQVKTSTGYEASFSSDGDSKSRNYYRFDMLIINNNFKKDIYEAHVYTYPELIKYGDKYYTAKELGLKKNEVFKDEFLLYSTNEYYIKDESGQYDISRAENNE